MKSSSLRYQSIRPASQARRPSLPPNRSRRLAIEPLEDRRLLSVVPEPLFDASAITAASKPDELVVCGDTMLFAADDGVHGRELWKTDGTEAGTVMVKDIWPGEDAGTSTKPFSSNPRGLTNVDGTLFFVATDYIHDRDALWRSDGTEAGTVKVVDVRGYSSTSPISMASVGGTLFFTKYVDEPYGKGLFKTDNTGEGTVRLAEDLLPGSNGWTLRMLTPVGRTLFFAAEHQLWKSDGSDAGTVLVKDFDIGDPTLRINSLIGIGDTLFLTLSGDADITELWRSDGTEAGTELALSVEEEGLLGIGSLTDVGGTLFFASRLPDGSRSLFRTDVGDDGQMAVTALSNGSNWLSRSDLTDVSGTLFFLADDGIHGQELWVSDGTPAGTRLVKDIEPGEDGSNAKWLTNVNGTLFFTVRTGNKKVYLYRSDGTDAGTVPVAQIGWGPWIGVPGYDGGPSSPLRPSASSLIAFGDKLAFVGNNGRVGGELWTSDGTEAGTAVVRDINQTTSGGYGFHSYDFVEVGSATYFRGMDRLGNARLFRSDGTREGTAPVSDVALDEWPLTAVGDKLFFVGQATPTGFWPWAGSGLWVTDGTAEGTTLTANFNPEYYCHPTVVGDKLFYFNGGGLHVTDGTSEGTTLLAEGNSTESATPWGDGPRPESPDPLATLDGTVFFTLQRGFWPPNELWKSDGTPKDTVKVEAEGVDDLEVQSDTITAAAGKIFFLGNTERGSPRLWMIDGVSNGFATQLSFLPDGVAFGVSSLSAAGDLLFFNVYSPADYAGVYRTDGTPEGTVALKRCYPSPVQFLVNVGDLLFFYHDGTLVRSDGTIDGTVALGNILPARPRGHFEPGRWPYYNSMPTIRDHELFFVGSDDSRRTALYRSDGTPEGTVPVKDRFYVHLDQGVLHYEGVVLDGRLFFGNFDPAHFWELWTSDGTEAGTVIYADLRDGPPSSRAKFLAIANDKLWFSADHSNGGRAPWVLDPHVIDTDAYKGNNHLQAAYYLGNHENTWLSEIAGLGVQAGSDWFRIDVDKYSERLIVELTHTFEDGDINVEVVDPLGNVWDSSLSITDSEQIDTVLPSSGTWYLRVAGAGRGNTYDLRFSTQYVHPGDANLDGKTDVRDFNIWNAHKFTDDTVWTSGDFNGNGRTDVHDFNVWNTHKFTSAPTRSSKATSPDAVRQSPADPDPVPIEAAWLYTQGPIRGGESDEPSPAERAVDALLATYWS